MESISKNVLKTLRYYMHQISSANECILILIVAVWCENIHASFLIRIATCLFVNLVHAEKTDPTRSGS